MSRREFLSACVVMVAAWVAGIKKVDYRALLSRIPTRLEEVPLGLLDIMQSSTLRGLSKTTYPLWATA